MALSGCGGGGGEGGGAPASSAKAITAFSLDGVAGTINETAKTISVTMPYGTNVTALVATFTSTGASVKVGSAVQTSGTTANDFTNPVSYTVTAADGTIAAYTVTVTVALSSAKAITAFSLDGVAGTINETAKTISVAMPYGTNVTAVTALVATFATTGESVTVGSAVQTSGTTANDFTSPVSYTVTAADGTTATYTVTVTVGKLPDTGQTGDYTATIGEDSDYTINSPSYTDNGDGTITDNVTKLTWQKCSPGQSGADCAAGTATEYSWDNAGTACAGLGTGWRLPTRMELLTIADYGVSAPAINGVSFPGTITWYYWTSTTYAGGTTNAWVVAFGGGTADWYDKTSVNYVRCVRGQ
ncbi:MAG: DUF1566 domain-containing protein [Nitrospirota bacterium]|nr:DUF1566 domain-containing protein [Nitrospirota bacterium]